MKHAKWAVSFCTSIKKTKHAKLLISLQSQISQNCKFVSQNNETILCHFFFHKIRNETSFAGNLKYDDRGGSYQKV
jgi:hypothetical protein